MSLFREVPIPGFPKGQLSMRRVGAFFFGGLVGSAAGIVAIVMKSDWKVVGVAFGIPYALLLGLLICTTVEDVKVIIAAAKGV